MYMDHCLETLNCNHFKTQLYNVNILGQDFPIIIRGFNFMFLWSALTVIQATMY
jgi:hypothetical protein